MKADKKHVADLIGRFIEGNIGPYEWDDFVSTPLDDGELEAIRRACASAPKEFPPTNKSHYCSTDGLAMLRNLASRLEAKPTK